MSIIRNLVRNPLALVAHPYLQVDRLFISPREAFLLTEDQGRFQALNLARYTSAPEPERW